MAMLNNQMVHRNHWKSRGDPLQLLQLSHLTHGPTCSAAQGAHRDAHLERSRFLVDGDAAFCKIDGFTQFKRFDPTRIGSLRIMEINLLHIQWATLRDIKRKQRWFPWQSSRTCWRTKSSDNSSPCCSRRNLPENRNGARVRLHPFLVLVFITFFRPTTCPFPFVNLLPLESPESKTLWKLGTTGGGGCATGSMPCTICIPTRVSPSMSSWTGTVVNASEHEESLSHWFFQVESSQEEFG